jgi:microcystin-dependent protein
MDYYLGQIQTFAFNFAPQYWAFCAGQLLPISQNSALFALIGTYYGGNGTTTFGLPDLRGRVPINQGQGTGQPAYSIGQTGGTSQVTLTSSNLPAHNHQLIGTNNQANNVSPAGLSLAQASWTDPNTGSPVPVQVYGPAGNPAVMSPTSIGMTGNSVPFGIMPPYLTINFCIALNGIFPPRS